MTRAAWGGRIDDDEAIGESLLSVCVEIQSEGECDEEEE